MKLQEVFDHLALGELSQLNLGVNTKIGVISSDNYDKVLKAISMGLTELHTRFNLKLGKLKLLVTAGNNDYVLKSTNAVSNGGATQYIVDTVGNPFRDDIIKIERIYSDDDTEYDINNEASDYNIRTINSYTLEVPDEIIEDTAYLMIHYRANHRIFPIGYNGYDPALVDIDLPYSHLQALCYFVGSRLLSPIGLVNDMNVGNTYAIKYEKECQLLENSGLEIGVDSQNLKFTNRGFV